MRISLRQLVAFGLLTITGLFVLLIVVNGQAVTAYRENTLQLSQEILPQVQVLNELRATLNDVSFESLIYVLTNNNEHHMHHRAADTRSRELLATLSTLLQADSTNQQRENNAFLVVSTTSNRLLTLTEEALIRQQRGNGADVLSIVAQFDESTELMNAAVDEFATALQLESEEVVAAARTNPLTFSRIIGIGTFLLMVGFFITLTRLVNKPLLRLRDATLAVANGDRSQQVPITGNNELGDLAGAFNTMVQRIAEQEQLLAQQVAAATAARHEAEVARAEVAEQLATIAQQRSVIQEMSVPILPLSNSAIVLPLVGALDTNRLMILEERALRAVQQNAIRHLILDITGVPVVDSQVAQGLINVVQAARLLGAKVLIVGIRPEVAQALVTLGISLDGVPTCGTLQEGIARTI